MSNANRSTLRTPKREYTIARSQTSSLDGMYWAAYQPINQRTGKTWQASRNLVGDCVVRWNSGNGDQEVIPGKDENFFRSHSDWTEKGKWTGGSVTFFTNAEAAFKAVYEDAAKRKEVAELI